MTRSRSHLSPAFHTSLTFFQSFKRSNPDSSVGLKKPRGLINFNSKRTAASGLEAGACVCSGGQGVCIHASSFSGDLSLPQGTATLI